MSANEQGTNPWATTSERVKDAEIDRLTKRVVELEERLQRVEGLHDGGGK